MEPDLASRSPESFPTVVIKSNPAFIGPRVWELEGPGPILKSSKMDVVIGFIRAPVP
jgi:hypothetical protein